MDNEISTRVVIGSAIMSVVSIAIIDISLRLFVYGLFDTVLKLYK